jgi:hypothetical protein
VNRIDSLVEKGANGLQSLSQKAATSRGLASKLAPELADDAAFLRKLKPSLMAARARGRAPTNQKPGEDVVAPSGPQLEDRPKQRKRGRPSPWIVLGVAFAAGVVLAKVIDWRGHAHPSD